jgi:hypothetical protein
MSNQFMMYAAGISFSLVCGIATSAAQEAQTLPGKGLNQHPFLYCGEWQGKSLDHQTMFRIEQGQIAWRFTNPYHGELGDCSRLSNGNIVFSRQFGASEVTPDKKIVWNFDAPQGTEIHTAYPIGNDKVLIMENGTPARLVVLRKKDNSIVKSLELPTGSNSRHGQFRHVRMTKKGTFLVAHMDMGKVVEYAPDGHVIWEVEAPSPWAAVRLANGNTLISGNGYGYVREVNPVGTTVWEIGKDELPGFPLDTVQEITRLANGHTLINNWTANLPDAESASRLQLIEVTPEKKVVWALKEWSSLGPASSTQLLDEPGRAERGELQR